MASGIATAHCTFVRPAEICSYSATVSSNRKAMPSPRSSRNLSANTFTPRQCCRPSRRARRTQSPHAPTHHAAGSGELARRHALRAAAHSAGAALIASAQSIFPSATQFACFDDAFHRTMPEVASHLPLPQRYFDAGIRRYGFHGLSYESLVHHFGDRASRASHLRASRQRSKPLRASQRSLHRHHHGPHSHRRHSHGHALRRSRSRRSSLPSAHRKTRRRCDSKICSIIRAASSPSPPAKAM